MYKVFRTDDFEKLMYKILTKEQQKRVGKIEVEISEEGFTGKPLGYKFLREKRVGGDKRIYFLVYEDLNAVLMVALSDKKTQQETIDKIKEYLPEFRRLMEELVKFT